MIRPHRKILVFTVAVAGILALVQAIQAQDDIPSGEGSRAESGVQEDMLLEPGSLPTYEMLRLREGEQFSISGEYLDSLRISDDDVLTSAIVFPEVPDTEPYARMTLQALVREALEGNFRLQNSSRGIEIARSNTRSAEADFIPFVDLVTDSRYQQTRDGDTNLQRDTFTNEGGVESGVELPTGGNISVNSGVRRTDTWTSEQAPLGESRSYSSDAEIRFLQPLLRGGGMDVGTADLRRARLNEIDDILGDQVTRRDVVFDVIQSYFRLLQSARQLEVSRDAITIRLQFLEETKVRYDVGRVDESEILRAEIQYLRELQTAVERQRNLDESREDILILLGLPLDTKMSFVDITGDLADRGRVEIPDTDSSIVEALESRLEMMRADISVKLSEIDKTVSRNNTWPSLDLDAGYRRGDADTEFHRSVGWEDESWDVGLGLRVPLVNIQRREAYRRSVLSLENQRTNRLSTERSLTQEVLTARRNLLATEVQLTILKKSVEQARKSLELINGRFEVGFATVTEVRLAQDDLFDAETNYSTTLLNYQLALARLYVALGRPLF